MEDEQLIERSSNFTLSLLSREEALGDPRLSFRTHKTFLLPLLSIAEECWVYGLVKGSAAWRAAGNILTPARGKFQVRTSDDPDSGREFFWNARRGERGTVVIVVPVEKLVPSLLFSACRDAWIFENYRSGHTPAAIKLAQSRIEKGRHVVFCLPRNNGFEWVEVFAAKPYVFELYAQALHQTKS